MASRPADLGERGTLRRRPASGAEEGDSIHAAGLPETGRSSPSRDSSPTFPHPMDNREFGYRLEAWSGMRQPNRRNGFRRTPDRVGHGRRLLRLPSLPATRRWNSDRSATPLAAVRSMGERSCGSITLVFVNGTLAACKLISDSDLRFTAGSCCATATWFRVRIAPRAARGIAHRRSRAFGGPDPAAGDGHARWNALSGQRSLNAPPSRLQPSQPHRTVVRPSQQQAPHRDAVRSPRQNCEAKPRVRFFNWAWTRTGPFPGDKN